MSEVLSSEQLNEQLDGLEGWSAIESSLRKTFSFDDFIQAVEFVGRVAEVAEERDHHPDIDIRYNEVILTLSTHDAGGVTGKDVSLATEIEALPQ